MKKFRAFISVFICVHLCLIPVFAQTNKKFRPTEKNFKRADKLLKKMTLDEKIGQLIHIGVNARFLNQDNAEYKEFARQVAENKVGGILVFAGDVYETVHFVNRMQALAKTPLLISADYETGAAMRFQDTINFPWNMAVAATGNPEYARRMGALAGREARALGVQWALAPVVDVNNNAANPVINVRSYGENPQDAARFGAAFADGLQSANVLATAKHFPGHGDTATDSHRGLPVIDVPRARLDALELVPFKAAIDDGVGSVMIGHISLPQIDGERITPLAKPINPTYAESEIITNAITIPSSLSPNVVSGILKKDLGFDGLVVTDALDMSGLTLYFNQDEAAVRALLAGADVLLKPASADKAIKGVKDAVASGRVSTARIDESVRKILAWKYKLGLFENKITPLDDIDKIVAGEEALSLTNEIADASVTLVKADERGALPLDKTKKIFLYCLTNGDDRAFVANTLQRTMRASGYNFETAVLDERATDEEINQARKKAKDSDVILAALFGRVRTGSTNSGALPKAGAELLRDFLKGDKPVVSVSFGNPYLLNNFPEMKTYAVAYGDMPSLQRAAARALAGEIDFNGKLPITVGEFARGTGIQINSRAAN